ncbi:MAG: 2-C-methyl-D-erythritol 4-phosphate cytidylyltransferase [Clostridia bacterium]|nr:2-C-methyl-D-erythritol 4-phosphate cytidylyltransferase [Clostridia bacterium]
MHKVTALIVAAGNGTRMNSSVKKQFLLIKDIPVFIHTVMAFQKSELIDDIVIVTAEEDIDKTNTLVNSYGLNKVSKVVAGGNTRTQSVKNGLIYVNSPFVAIHDGARPCIKAKHIEQVVVTAVKYGGATLGVPVTDTLKAVTDDEIKNTVDRNGLWCIQTPQCFDTEVLKDAYIKSEGLTYTDDCQIFESRGLRVKVVAGDKSNIKITTGEDLELAKFLLKN